MDEVANKLGVPAQASGGGHVPQCLIAGDASASKLHLLHFVLAAGT